MRQKHGGEWVHPSHVIEISGVLTAGSHHWGPAWRLVISAAWSNAILLTASYKADRSSCLLASGFSTKGLVLGSLHLGENLGAFLGGGELSL